MAKVVILVHTYVHIYKHLKTMKYEMHLLMVSTMREKTCGNITKHLCE